MITQLNPAALAPVQSVFGRTGAVVSAAGDYTAAQVTNAADKSSATTQSFAGTLDISAAGKGLAVSEGANGKQGLATLVAGTVTVNTTAVTANSRIFLTAQTVGGTQGILAVTARTAGASFTITSSNAADTSTVAWEIIEPG